MYLKNALRRLCVLSILVGRSSARQFNITIDDQQGDPSNGNHISYTPSDAWNVGQTCTACTAKVTPQSDAYLGTWMDATFNPTGNATNNAPGQIPQASVSFTGKVVSVYRFVRLSMKLGSTNLSLQGQRCTWFAS